MARYDNEIVKVVKRNYQNSSLERLDHWIKSDGRRKLLGAALRASTPPYDSLLTRAPDCNFELQSSPLLQDGSMESKRDLEFQRKCDLLVFQGPQGTHGFKSLTQLVQSNLAHDKPQDHCASHANVQNDVAHSKKYRSMSEKVQFVSSLIPIPSPYVDKIYQEKVRSSVETKNLALYNEKISKVIKKVESAQLLFRQSIDKKVEKLAENIIFAVHSQFRHGKWTCRALVLDVHIILESPMRYTLISREEYDEFGQGRRLLRKDEWKALDEKRPCVGQIPHVENLLRRFRIEEALSICLSNTMIDAESISILENICDVRNRIFKSNGHSECRKFPTASACKKNGPIFKSGRSDASSNHHASGKMDSLEERLFVRIDDPEISREATLKRIDGKTKGPLESAEPSITIRLDPSAHIGGLQIFDQTTFDVSHHQERIENNASFYAYDLEGLEQDLESVTNEELLLLLEVVPDSIDILSALELKRNGTNVATYFQTTSNGEADHVSFHDHAEDAGQINLQQLNDHQEVQIQSDPSALTPRVPPDVGYKGLTLTLQGFDIRKKIVLSDLLPNADHIVARNRSCSWVMKTCNALYLDKSSSDTADQSNDLPRSRFPIFVYHWTLRKYGLPDVAAQNLIDLVHSARSFEQNSSAVYLFLRCFDEDFNAGQISVLLNCRSLFHALSCRGIERPGTWTHYIASDRAQCVAASVLEFASDVVKQKLKKQIIAHSDVRKFAETVSSWINVEDALNIVVQAYDEARCQVMTVLEQEYEELLAELSRGLQQDGRDGRPLDCAIPFARMSQFLTEALDLRPGLFETLVIALLEQGYGVLSPKTHVLRARGLPELIDINDVIAIDTVADLFGFDSAFYRFWPSSGQKLFSDNGTTLYAVEALDLSILSADLSLFKAAVHALSKRSRQRKCRTRALGPARPAS